MTPVVTVADLDALAARLPSHTHAAIAAELGLSRTHVTHLYRGTKSLNSGAILTLLAKLLREYGVWGARRRAAAAASSEWVQRDAAELTGKFSGTGCAPLHAVLHPLHAVLHLQT